ncbi:hypothetical protein KKF61_01360 [Patescibacteria group bacterium]|nr:hypothetical protein [Patescibacteria group bacterium]MBU0964264.1 hypothetical protein [Patescibacteria group bacterium]
MLNKQNLLAAALLLLFYALATNESTWWWIPFAIIGTLFLAHLISNRTSKIHCPRCGSRHYKVEVRPAYWQTFGLLKITKNRYHYKCLDCGKKWTVAYHDTDT